MKKGYAAAIAARVLKGLKDASKELERGKTLLKLMADGKFEIHSSPELQGDEMKIVMHPKVLKAVKAEEEMNARVDEAIKLMEEVRVNGGSVENVLEKLGQLMDAASAVETTTYAVTTIASAIQGDEKALRTARDKFVGEYAVKEIELRQKTTKKLSELRKALEELHALRVPGSPYSATKHEDGESSATKDDDDDGES